MDDYQLRLKALNDVLGMTPEHIQQGINPLDVLSMAGRGYDSVAGAPTRAAIQAGSQGENPITAAYNQFGKNPDTAPDFGFVGNTLADPLLLSGVAAKGIKYAGQLPDLSVMLSRAPNMHSASNGSQFSDAISQAIKERPMIKDFISDYSPEDFDKFKTFLSGDKKSGFAIKPDGDLINVFSSDKGRGDAIMLDAINQKPKTLDAYDVKDKLPELYGKYGFNEIKREPNWTPGGPDVVYMKRGFVENKNDIDNQIIKNALKLKALQELNK